MPQVELPPEPWDSFLKELDESVQEETQLHCIGGFVISLLYGFSRPTADIDVLSVTPRDSLEKLRSGTRGGPLHRKHNVYLDLVTIVNIPEDYDARLTPMFAGGYRYLRLLALDPYDLALSKLERNIQRDRDDVLHLFRSMPLDVEILRKRYQIELRWQLGNPKREDLTLKLWLEAIEEQRSSSR